MSKVQRSYIPPSGSDICIPNYNYQSRYSQIEIGERTKLQVQHRVTNSVNPVNSIANREKPLPNMYTRSRKAEDDRKNRIKKRKCLAKGENVKRARSDVIPKTGAIRGKEITQIKGKLAFEEVQIFGINRDSYLVNSKSNLSDKMRIPHCETCKGRNYYSADMVNSENKATKENGVENKKQVISDLTRNNDNTDNMDNGIVDMSNKIIGNNLKRKIIENDNKM